MVGFTMAEVCVVYVLLLEGLRDIHARQVIHCDVKSANVLIQFGYDRGVKMRLAYCDFGLA